MSDKFSHPSSSLAGRILPLFSISVLYFRLDFGCKNYYFLNLGPECRLKGWKMCSGWVRLFRGHSMLLEWESLQGKKGQHNLEMKSSTNTVDLDWHKKGSQHCSRCLFCCCPWNYNMEKKSGGFFERHPLFISSFFPYCFFLKYNFLGSLLTYIIFNDSKFRKRFWGITVREFLSKLLTNRTKHMLITQERKISAHHKQLNTFRIISLGFRMLFFRVAFPDAIHTPVKML